MSVFFCQGRCDAVYLLDLRGEGKWQAAVPLTD